MAGSHKMQERHAQVLSFLQSARTRMQLAVTRMHFAIFHAITRNYASKYVWGLDIKVRNERRTKIWNMGREKYAMK